jgi:hypothetical protein
MRVTFYQVLEQVLDLLQRHGRISYRALKRQFDLDDTYIADLKAELIEILHLATDQDGTMLVWAGGPGTTPVLAQDQTHTPQSTLPQTEQPHVTPADQTTQPAPLPAESVTLKPNAVISP